MLNRDATRQQEVTDQSPMTTPKHGLRTHDRRSFMCGDLQQPLDTLVKILGAHVTGVVDEHRVRYEFFGPKEELPAVST